MKSVANEILHLQSDACLRFVKHNIEESPPLVAPTSDLFLNITKIR